MIRFTRQFTPFIALLLCIDAPIRLSIEGAWTAAVFAFCFFWIAATVFRYVIGFLFYLTVRRVRQDTAIAVFFLAGITPLISLILSYALVMLIFLNTRIV